MKRILSWLISLLVLNGFVHAEAPYGILVNAINDPSYAMDFLLKGQPIRYKTGPDITPQEEKIFVNNFQRWPHEVLRWIENSGRENEFSDITPILRRGLRAEKNSSYDVLLLLDKQVQTDGGVAGGFVAHHPYHNNRATITVVSKFRDAFESVTMHEIGHYYGLADQYGPDNADPAYSTHPSTLPDSVMQGGDYYNAYPSCDDADGFINFLDLRVFQRSGYFSPRARKGWKSLCEGSSMRYQNAQPVVLRDPPPVQFMDQNRLPLFTVNPKDKVQRDEQTRWLKRITSKTGWGKLCPLKKGTAFLEFNLNYTVQELEIFCNTSISDQQEPAYRFPLPYASDWYVTIEENALGKTISTDISFRNRRLDKVEITQTTPGSQMLFSLSKASAQPGEYLAQIKMGSHTQMYKLSEQDFAARINLLSPVYKQLLFRLRASLDKRFEQARNLNNNFYQPMLRDRTTKHQDAITQQYIRSSWRERQRVARDIQNLH